MNLWKFANFVFSLFYLLSKTFFVNSCWGQLNCLFVIWQAGLPSSQIVKYPYNPKKSLRSAQRPRWDFNLTQTLAADQTATYQIENRLLVLFENLLIAGDSNKVRTWIKFNMSNWTFKNIRNNRKVASIIHIKYSQLILMCEANHHIICWNCQFCRISKKPFFCYRGKPQFVENGFKPLKITHPKVFLNEISWTGVCWLTQSCPMSQNLISSLPSNVINLVESGLKANLIILCECPIKLGNRLTSMNLPPFKIFYKSVSFLKK